MYCFLSFLGQFLALVNEFFKVFTECKQQKMYKYIEHAYV